MRILGIDYGDVYMGMAVCDVNEFLASGLRTAKVKGLHDAAEIIAETAKEENAEKIVIGMPFNVDGRKGDRVEKTLLLIQYLGEICDIPVETMDERYTTVEAYTYLNATGASAKKKKGVVNTLSATIILQDYLDMKKNRA
ncbi:MAG: Holliday junction resolvase RuvX [Ruminococcaceae bacterium]|nr:Holliday junction resolvase RuvX [Oscillospiraceae bacterium]